MRIELMTVGLCLFVGISSAEVTVIDSDTTISSGMEFDDLVVIQDDAVVNITGGTFRGGLMILDEASVRLSGGDFYDDDGPALIMVYGWGKLNFSGAVKYHYTGNWTGQSRGFVMAVYDRSTVIVDGGGFDDGLVHNDGETNPRLSEIYLNGLSILHYYRMVTSDDVIEARHGGTIDIHGDPYSVKAVVGGNINVYSGIVRNMECDNWGVANIYGGTVSRLKVSSDSDTMSDKVTNVLNLSGGNIGGDLGIDNYDETIQVNVYGNSLRAYPYGGSFDGGFTLALHKIMSSRGLLSH